MPSRERDHALRHRRYDRDSLEFGRVVNLSDALFAIAMTLLVFSTMEASGCGWTGSSAPSATSSAS
jgi:uncharacterized membrane protein